MISFPDIVLESNAEIDSPRVRMSRRTGLALSSDDTHGQMIDLVATAKRIVGASERIPLVMDCSERVSRSTVVKRRRTHP